MKKEKKFHLGSEKCLFQILSPDKFGLVRTLRSVRISGAEKMLYRASILSIQGQYGKYAA